MDLAGLSLQAPSKDVPPPSLGSEDDSDDDGPVADFNGSWGGDVG